MSSTFYLDNLDISYLSAQDLTVNCGMTLCTLHLLRLSWQLWCKRINHSLASLVTLSPRILVFLTVLNILSLIIIESLTFPEILKSAFLLCCMFIEHAFTESAFALSQFLVSLDVCPTDQISNTFHGPFAP